MGTFPQRQISLAGAKLLPQESEGSVIGVRRMRIRVPRLDMVLKQVCPGLRGAEEWLAGVDGTEQKDGPGPAGLLTMARVDGKIAC